MVKELWITETCLEICVEWSLYETICVSYWMLFLRVGAYVPLTICSVKLSADLWVVDSASLDCQV